jgi:hypothetical protein
VIKESDKVENMYFFDGKEIFIQKITKEFISYPDLTGGSI